MSPMMSQTETASPSREIVPYAPPAAKTVSERFYGLVGSSVFKAAIVGVALAAGWVAGSTSTQGERARIATESTGQIEKLRSEIASLRDTFTGQADQDRQAVKTMRTGIEDMQRTTASTLIRLSGAVDRAEADRMADFSKLVERMARIEKQISDQTPVATIPKAQLPAPAQAAAQETRVPMSAPAAAAKAETTIRGIVLRGVSDGVALVQTRNGMREIAPGDRLAGAGRVQSIEKRGRKWVIVTSEGIIDGEIH